MSSISLQLKYRPLRIGWCLRDEDFDSLRAIIKLNSIAWGGVFNPIINVDDTENAMEQINSFRPDILLSIEDDYELRSFINRFPFLNAPWGLTSFLIDKNPSVLDIRHVLANYKSGSGLNLHTERLFTATWDDSDPLSDLLLVSLGKFPSPGTTEFDFWGAINACGKGNTETIDLATPIKKSLMEQMNPLKITQKQIYPNHRRGRSGPGVYLGSSTCFKDLISFWNIRAAHRDIVFIDPKFQFRLSEWKDMFLKRYHEFLVSASDWNKELSVYTRDKVLFETASIYFPETSLLCYQVGDLFWNHENLDPPTPYISRANVLGNIFEKIDKPNLSFELGDRPTENEMGINRQKYIVSIDPIYSPEFDRDFTFKPLFVPELNQFYSRECFGYSPDCIRIEPDGLGIVIEAHDTSISLSAIRGGEMLTKIFSIFDLSTETSAAGRIAKQIQLQMGGIQGCRVFKIAGVRQLMEDFKPIKHFDRNAAVSRIGNNDPQTGRPRFDDYKGLYLEPRKKKDLSPKDCFRYLLKKKILRVGITFCCSKCELETWLPIDEIRSTPSCSYCGNAEDIVPDIDDRSWQYRKTGLFGNENNQEGAIPVLAALQQLEVCNGPLGEAFKMYATIFKNSTRSINCEADFIYVSSRKYEKKIEIVFAECKNRKQIERKDLENLTTIADLFPSDRFSTYILLAKFEDFSSDELKMIRLFQGKYRKNLILWSKRELEPYDIYEKTRDAFQFNRHDKSLSGLAEASHVTYLEANAAESDLEPT